MPLVALSVIASRASRLLLHPLLIDVLAIVGSLTLAIVAIYEAFRGRAKRGAALLVAEGLLTAFVAWHLDYPWAQKTAWSPAISWG